MSGTVPTNLSLSRSMKECVADRTYKYKDFSLSIKSCVAELVAMTLFVYIVCGTATSYATRTAGALKPEGDISEIVQTMVDVLQVEGSWEVTLALASGLAIVVLAYATSHLSGGQLNPAVSLGLLAAGSLGPAQAMGNIIAQIVGAILGVAFLDGTIPDNLPDNNLGANAVNPRLGPGNAFLGECVMTFALMLVVLETAVNTKSSVKAQAPLAIGLAVFCAHAVLIPVDGCSINPARSLGSAVVSGYWDGTNFWVFVIGPIVGALFAVPFHFYFRSSYDSTPPTDPVDLRGLGDEKDSRPMQPLAKNPPEVVVDHS